MLPGDRPGPRYACYETRNPGFRAKVPGEAWLLGRMEKRKERMCVSLHHRVDECKNVYKLQE